MAGLTSELLERYIDEEIDVQLKRTLSVLRDKLHKLHPQHVDLIDKIVEENSYPIRSTLSLTCERKTRKKNVIPDKDRCHARTGNGQQCRRPMLETSDYCMSHNTSLPYGDISQPERDPQIGRKRGRRTRLGDYTTEDLIDSEKYVQAVCTKLNGEYYLVDEHDLVYAFNTNCEIVGHLQSDGTSEMEVIMF
jgi:hypothetical protein